MRTLRLSHAVLSAALVFLIALSAQAQYGGGSGTSEAPYLIYTPEHLEAIGLDPNSWDKHFKLMSDLDMIAYQGASESETVRPIGTYGQRPFSGHFDGNGHTISHLTVRGDGLDPVGLFGYVEAPVRADLPWPDEVELIKDLGLIDPNVQSPSSWRGVGALVGYLGNGKICSCYVRGGTVKGKDSAGGLLGSALMRSMPATRALCNCYVQDTDVEASLMVGGLVGQFSLGHIDNCWSVARVRGQQYVGGLVGLFEMQWERDNVSMCWSSGTVEGTRDVGGLAGVWWGSGAITECYSTAAVQGGSATGGLVGTNTHGTIANCYSVAPVCGVSQVGGLVGANQGTVSACYAAGPVKGQLQMGGLISSLNGEAFYAERFVSDSFWDIDTSGQPASAGGEGRNTFEMRQRATFVNWDFNDVWDIAEHQTYPFLRREKGDHE